MVVRAKTGEGVAVAIKAMKQWLSEDTHPAPISPKRVAEAANDLPSPPLAATYSSISPQIATAAFPDKMKPKVLGGGDLVQDQPLAIFNVHQEKKGSETSCRVLARSLEQSDSSRNVFLLDQQNVGGPGAYGVSKISQNENIEPLQVPLHAIEAITSYRKALSQKQKPSTGTWSISDLENTKIDKMGTSGAAPKYVMAPRATGISDPSVPDTSIRVAPKFPVTDREYSILNRSTGLDANVIGLWILDTGEPPGTVFLPEDSSQSAFHRCDIDSVSGKVLPPTSFPDTIPSRSEGPCRDYRDICWRKENMTSELQIVRELKSRQRLGEHIRVSLQQNQIIKAPSVAPLHQDESFPSAECTLRPATPADFQRIAEIMNLESQQGECPQILESKLVSVIDIDGIFQYCKANSRPFIVAVSAENALLDRSRWPKNSGREYREYVRYRNAQPCCAPAVVGFAFVSEPRMGFLETPCPGSRYSCQARVVVHPGHRQQSYGTALLDRTLLSLCSNHSNLIDYNWQCPAPAHIYKPSIGHKNRQYARVYVEMYCEGKTTIDFKWRAEMLRRFNFVEVAHLRQAVKTDRDANSQWLDLVLWEFEAS